MNLFGEKIKSIRAIIEKSDVGLSILILSLLTFLFCWIMAVQIENGQNYVMVSIQCQSRRICNKKNEDLYRIMEKSLQQNNRSQYFDLYKKDGMIFIRQKNISSTDFITTAYEMTNQAIDKFNDNVDNNTIIVYIYEAPL